MACPAIDIDNPAGVSGVYSQFEASGFNTPALSAATRLEATARMIELYGTSDIQTIVDMWEADLTLIPVDGSWGFSHAATTLTVMQAVIDAGGTNADACVAGDTANRRWYAREAIARCNDGTLNWLNPAGWSEDSRLDYYMPVFFTEHFCT